MSIRLCFARLLESVLSDESLYSCIDLIGECTISIYLSEWIPSCLARLFLADIRSTISELVELVETFHASYSTKSDECSYMPELDCALSVFAKYRVPLFWIVSTDESCFLEIVPVVFCSTESDFYDESFYIAKIPLELVNTLRSKRVIVVIKFSVVLFDEL